MPRYLASPLQSRASSLTRTRSPMASPRRSPVPTTSSRKAIDHEDLPYKLHYLRGSLEDYSDMISDVASIDDPYIRIAKLEKEIEELQEQHRCTEIKHEEEKREMELEKCFVEEEIAKLKKENKEVTEENTFLRTTIAENFLAVEVQEENKAPVVSAFKVITTQDNDKSKKSERLLPLEIQEEDELNEIQIASENEDKERYFISEKVRLSEKLEKILEMTEKLNEYMEHVNESSVIGSEGLAIDFYTDEESFKSFNFNDFGFDSDGDSFKSFNSDEENAANSDEGNMSIVAKMTKHFTEIGEKRYGYVRVISEVLLISYNLKCLPANMMANCMERQYQRLGEKLGPALKKCNVHLPEPVVKTDKAIANNVTYAVATGTAMHPMWWAGTAVTGFATFYRYIFFLHFKKIFTSCHYSKD